MPLDTAYKVFAVTLFAAIGASTYYSAWRITKNQFAAMTASIIGISAWPILNCFHRYMSLGAMNSAIFVPLALAGMFVFLCKNEKPTLLMAGTIGLLYTQAIGTFLTGIACACMLLLFAPKMISEKRLLYKLKQLIVSMVIVLLITAPYWFQMLEQSRKQRFKVSTPWQTSEENVLGAFELITSPDGIGWLLAIVLVSCICYQIYRYKHSKQSEIDVFLYISAGFIAVTIWFEFWHFWNSIMHVTILQGPGRLHIITVYMIALLVAGYIEEAQKSGRCKGMIFKIGITLIIIIPTVITAPDQFCLNFKDREDLESAVYQVVHNEIAGVGAGEEWLPLASAREYMQNPYEAIRNDGGMVSGTRSKGMNRFSFDANMEADYYEAPYIYYKGYAAITEDGKKLPIEQMENGNVKVVIPGEMKSDELCRILVYYEGTKYQKLSYLMMVTGAIWWIVRKQNKKEA